MSNLSEVYGGWLYYSLYFLCIFGYFYKAKRKKLNIKSDPNSRQVPGPGRSTGGIPL